MRENYIANRALGHISRLKLNRRTSQVHQRLFLIDILKCSIKMTGLQMRTNTGKRLIKELSKSVR